MGGTKKGPTSDQPQTLVCCVKECRQKATRMEFCGEHFDHYKFGLIRKDGTPAADYSRKLEHYQAYVDRQRSRKAA